MSRTLGLIAAVLTLAICVPALAGEQSQVAASWSGDTRDRLSSRS